MKYVCPNCGTQFEGKPKFCPECGVKLNWPVEEPEPAPVPKMVMEEPAPAPRPVAKPKMDDDDAPYYAAPQAARARAPKPYALVFKILMMAFSGTTGLFALICLLTYIGSFMSAGSNTTYSGYKLAFYFSGNISYLGGATCVGPLLGFLGVLAIIGLSIPRIINDIKFFSAKEGTMKVAKRKKKSLLWLILMPSILLVSIVMILCTNAFAGTTKYSDVSLGGGAVGTVVLMFFMMSFIVAEEVIVMTALKLQPRSY